MNNETTETLLIVEDDKNFSKLMQDYLEHQGYQTVACYDGNAMMAYLSEHTVSLIILDVMLPGEDGLSLVRWLRSNADNTLPILMLSALGDEVDRIVGLEIGADDYLAKPPSLREVLARVRALLRRSQAIAASIGASTMTANCHRFGDFSLNMGNHTLSNGTEQIPLTNTEFHLLAIFVTNPNKVLSRDRLMNLIKGYDHTPYDRSIDVQVSRLRGKIEPNPAEPTYIRTIRGEGYLFSP
jgi:two-component system phosphate regulon response regulator OmpR